MPLKVTGDLVTTAEINAFLAYAARVTHNANQSITTTATQQALIFNTEHFDTDSIHDIVTNNNRLTCRTAGTYAIYGCAEFAANATGYRQLSVRVGGTNYVATVTIPSAGAGPPSVVAIATHWNLAVGEYVELMALQTSGGALNVNATSNYSPVFSMAKVA